MAHCIHPNEALFAGSEKLIGKAPEQQGKMGGAFHIYALVQKADVTGVTIPEEATAHWFDAR